MQAVCIGRSRLYRGIRAALMLSLVLLTALSNLVWWAKLLGLVLLAVAAIVDGRRWQANAEGAVLRREGGRLLLISQPYGAETLLALQPVLLSRRVLIARIRTERGWRYLWVPADAVADREHWHLRRLALRGLGKPGEPG